MSDEIYTFALKNTLNEIRNACPTVTQAFIFTENAEIISADENTDDATLHSAANAIKAIIQRADAVGGIDAVTFNNTNGKTHITHIGNFYLTTITSKETDENYINSLTQVLVPVVLKLVAKIHNASTDYGTFITEKPEAAETSEQEPMVEETNAADLEPEPFLPKPPVNQLIIDNLNGLLAPSDTVRIDNTTITQWKKLYPNKKIGQVEAEALNGKTTRCKFKPIKDSKHEGKGAIQMPEKIQLALQTKKGELVMIKPVIE